MSFLGNSTGVLTLLLSTVLAAPLRGQAVTIPLDTASWRYWSLDIPCCADLTNGSYKSPGSAVLESTPEGLKAYGSTSRGYSMVHTLSSFDLRNKTIYLKWKAHDAGAYMHVPLYLTTDSGSPYLWGVETTWWLTSTAMTTNHSFNGSILIQSDVWYYTRATVSATTLSSVTATGNYDSQGGAFVDATTRTVPGTSPVTVAFGINDNYGGTAASVVLGDVRIDAGPPAYWTLKSPLTSPPIRGAHAMAFDAARGQMVLFGGWASSTGDLGDTWTWDGTTWTQRMPLHSPPPRRFHDMVYDAARNEVVLFGGWSDTLHDLGDTWIWNGVDWERRSPATSPSARTFHKMAYDAAHGKTVLFAGVSGANPSGLRDTWSWNGINWTQELPANSPPTRWQHAMAYDAARERVVVFGGWGVSSGLDDTWIWDGTNWAQQSPAARPSLRWGAAMAFDAASRQVVLFGGYRGPSMNDTWIWDGTNWTPKASLVIPPGREIHAMAYDSVRREVVLFGGADESGGTLHTLYSDTWGTLAGDVLFFSGRLWHVRRSQGDRPIRPDDLPGPNFWSGSPDNVWVDAAGRLHLKITKGADGLWRVPEVVSVESFGLGTYTFELDSAANFPDPNVVLGMFVFTDADASPNTASECRPNEIDVEFSRWGVSTPAFLNPLVSPWALGKYGVAPNCGWPREAGELFPFSYLPGQGLTSTQAFTWRQDSVSFRSLRAGSVSPAGQSCMSTSWLACAGVPLWDFRFTSHVPVPNEHKVHINLWLLRGQFLRDPANTQYEVVVKSFGFHP